MKKKLLSLGLAFAMMGSVFVRPAAAFSYVYEGCLLYTSISCALELLKTTDKRVLEICYDVGFNNVNHFNRMFKQYVGMSPVVYRKSQ